MSVLKIKEEYINKIENVLVNVIMIDLSNHLNIYAPNNVQHNTYISKLKHVLTNVHNNMLSHSRINNIVMILVNIISMNNIIFVQYNVLMDNLKYKIVESIVYKIVVLLNNIDIHNKNIVYNNVLAITLNQLLNHNLQFVILHVNIILKQ